MKTKTEILTEALEAIVALQPCCDSSSGSCFYLKHDADGKYIGEQYVKPLGVIQRMAQTAQEALSNTR